MADRELVSPDRSDNISVRVCDTIQVVQCVDREIVWRFSLDCLSATLLRSIRGSNKVGFSSSSGRCLDILRNVLIRLSYFSFTPVSVGVK